jgi:uncharacterized protein YfaS (alpha-2-macroglobulin family)
LSTQKLSRSLALCLLGLAALVSVVAAAGGSDVVLDALLQRPKTASGTVVVPDRFVRSWDPVTVFFGSAKGPASGGPEDDAGRFVRLEPDHPGAWTWLDGRTLQFRPAEPWPPLETVALRADGATTVLSTLLSPPSTSPAHGAVGLGPVETVTLTFREPVDPSALARMVTLELRPLPGLGEGPASRRRSGEFEVKQLERGSARESASYTLVLREPIGLGQRVVVRVALSQDEASDEAVSEAVFSTAEPFRPAFIGCDGSNVPVSPEGTRHPAERPLRCAGAPLVRLGFTAALGAVGPLEARNLVRFEPAVDDLRFEAGGTEMRVRGAFLPEVPYRVSLSPAPLQDAAGRPLEISGESVAWLYFPRRESFLRWGVGQGIAEAQGPRRLPVEGRSVAHADVRLYRIDPLNRSFWPFPEQPIGLDEETRPPGPGEEAGAWEDPEHIPPHEVAMRLLSLGSPVASALLPTGLQSGQGARLGLELGPLLDTAGGKNAPGHWLVGMRRLDGSSERTWVRLQVTDLALTTVEGATDVLFQVTSLQSGAGVGGATVRLEGLREGEWASLAELRTGGDGTVRWPAPGEGDASVRRLVVQKGDDVLVLDATRPPDRFADGVWLESSEEWLSWAFSSLDSRKEEARTLVHLFTERPIYRPGEVVHLGGYARSRLQGRLSALGGAGAVRLDGPGGEYRLPIELSRAGNFHVDWQEEEPPTGTYRATLELGGAEHGSVSFQVESYRLPTFEVELHGPDNATTVPNDRPFDVGLLASYYAGGRVAARPVRWRVTQYPFAWTPAQVEGFAWASDDRYGRGGTFRATPELTLEATTSADGAATLPLDPGNEVDARPRTYVIEATVTGADDQTVTQTLQVQAVPAFVLGLQVPRYLERADSIPVQALAMGPDGEPVSGVEITLRTIHRQWHSVLQASDFTSGEARYLTDTVDVPKGERAVTSGKRPASVSMPVDAPGVWLVEAEARDELGRVQVVRVDLFAGGEGAVGWEKPEAGTFDVATDEASYRPGQTARLVVRSPYQEGAALVVIEAPQGNRYQHLAVRGGQAVAQIPIETGWVPQVPVHVVVRRGRLGAAPSAERLDLAKPQTVASTVWLGVQPVENQVDVELSAPARALPGQTVPVTVSLAGPDGRPLAGEVTLWLLDRAILGLAREARLDPVPDFIDQRPSQVSVRDTRNLVLGRVPRAEMPGGDGEGPEEESLLEHVTVRKDFQPVAYHAPSLAVPASGTLTVQVKLPDNVTVWAMRAKAASGAERFGSGTGDLAVRLPVVVQPALPRFVRPGDQFEAAALVRVVEGAGGPGAAELSAEGLTVSGPARRELALDPALAARVAWPVTVPTPQVTEDGKLAREQVTVKVGAKRASDGAADAFASTLPLRDDRRVRYERSLVTLAPGGTGEIPPLPEQARPGSVRRTVVVASDDALVRMAAGLDVLRTREAHGADALISRGRVAVGLGALRGPLGLEDDAEIRRIVEETQAALAQSLDANGLVAPWPGARGRVWLTADALAFLADAADQGYPVDARIRAALERSLTASLRSDYAWFLDKESWMERSAALWGLALDGRFDAPYFAELMRRRSSLVPEAQARVLLAAARGGEAGSSSGQALREALTAELVTELYQGRERLAGLKSRRTDRHPLVVPSEAREYGALLQALVASGSEDPKLPLLADALVRLGAEDGWGQPNADAAALLALAAWLQERPGAPPQVSLTEGSDSATLSGGPVARRSSTWSGETVLRNTGSAPVTALVVTRWIPLAPGDQQKPESSGFVVEREWLVVRPDGPPDRHPIPGGAELALRVGDVVEEHVRIVNPEDRHHAVVTVPLAAGLEPLNPALATSGPEATPTGRSTASPTWTSLGDDRAVYTFESLPKGTWDLYFRTRATVAGSYVQPAAVAELVYDRDVIGWSGGARIVVQAAP